MRAETSSHPNHDISAKLRDMGFPEELIVLAVSSGHNNINKAIEYIEANPLAKHATASSSSNIRAAGPAASTGATATSAPIDVDDSEYHQAIVASKQEALDAKAKADDAELARAIAASLKDSVPARVSWPDELGTYPERRVRADMSTPVGLRNIGNTCYLNSLLQVYFHLHSFRRAVLSYRHRPADQTSAPGATPVAPVVSGIDDPESGNSSDTAAAAAQAKERAAHAQEFMVELQRLFAQMALGNQSVVDPSALIRAMRDPDGKQIEIGAQEDASEFNQIFLEMAQLAVAPEKVPTVGQDAEMKGGADGAASSTTPAEESEAGSNFVRTLFTTNFKQEVVLATSAAAGASSPSVVGYDVQKPDVVSTEGNMSAFFVDATTEDNRELYHGLDEYVQTGIEYRFDSPEKVPQVTRVAAVDGSRDDSMCIVSVDEGSDKMKIDTVSAGNVGLDRVRKAAIKTEWFTDLAPVLTIYLKRARYNRETSLPEKVHEKYVFDTELAMDRYLENNRVESERARRKVGKIQAQRLETEGKLNGIIYFPDDKPRGRSSGPASIDASRATVVRPVMIGPLEKKDMEMNFEHTDTSLGGPNAQEGPDDYFSALDRVKKRISAARDSNSPYFVDKLSSEAISNAFTVLERLESEDRFLKTALRERVDALAIEESKCYELLRNVRYRLFAVLVHDGAPASGHYLVFIRSGCEDDGGKYRWMRFSDVSMAYVTEEEMLQWSIGGHGHASAYCLIYASSSQIPSAQSQPEGEKFLEECRKLLPKERLEEVNILNAAFDKELLDYRVKVQRNKAQSKARSIVGTATSELRAATMNDLGMKGSSAESSSLGKPPLRIRSVVEFCIAAKNIYNAIGHALHAAWSIHGADETSATLFDVVRKSNRAKLGYPPLVGGSSPETILATDLDLLVLEEVFAIMRSQKMAPPLGSGDSPFMNFAEAKQLPRFMETQLPTLESKMAKASIMYRFALRSTGLAACAMRASLRGSWISALWMWYHLSKWEHVLSPRDVTEDLRPLAIDYSAINRDRDPYYFAKHDALQRHVAPTVLLAASDDAAERIRLGSAEGHSFALFVAEHALRQYHPQSDVVAILLEDWESFLSEWRNGRISASLQANAVETATKVVDILLRRKRPSSIGIIVPIDAAVQKSMEEACVNAAATAFGFNKYREQVFGLGLIASDAPSLRTASTQLRAHAMSAAER